MATPPKDYPLFDYITNKEAIMIVCFCGGFMDAIGYVMLHGLFTASITGNIVTAVIPIYKDEKGFLPRFSVWVAIAIGSWVTTSFSMKIRFVTLLNKWQVGIALFGCEVAALLVAMAIGASLEYPDIDSWQTILLGVLMAFSMGVQNGAAMVMIPNCPPTTAMSGNTVRMGIYAAEAFDFYLASQQYIQLYPTKAGKPPDYDAKMRKNSEEMFTKFSGSLSAISSFACGSMIGVPFGYHIGLGGIFFPVLVIGGLMVNIYIAGKKANADMVKNGTNVIEMETVESPMFQQIMNGEQSKASDSNTASPAANGGRHYSAVETTYDGGAHHNIEYSKTPSYSVFADANDEKVFSSPELKNAAITEPYTLKNLSTTASEAVYKL